MEKINPLYFHENTTGQLDCLLSFAQSNKRSKTSVVNDYCFDCETFAITIESTKTALKDGRFDSYIESIEHLGWISQKRFSGTSHKYTFFRSVDLQPWEEFVKEHTFKHIERVKEVVEREIKSIEEGARAKFSYGFNFPIGDQNYDYYWESRRANDMINEIEKYKRAMEKHKKLNELLECFPQKVSYGWLVYQAFDFHAKLAIASHDKDLPLFTTYDILGVASSIQWCLANLLDPTNKQLPR